MLVISQAKELLVQATNMENGMRGFLLAGTKEFLEPYHQGKQALTEQINELLVNSFDNQEQFAALEEIHANLKAWDSEVIEPAIALYATKLVVRPTWMTLLP